MPPDADKPARPLPTAPPGPPIKKPGSRWLVRIGVGAVALAVLGFLFLRSVRSARSEAYTVPRETLSGWHVELVEAETSADPMLAVRVPSELISSLFNQVFARAMESLRSPQVIGIPLVLQGELERGLRGRATPETLLAAARAAGLNASTLRPRCLAYRRIATPAGVSQLYFVLFEEEAFARFRKQVAAQAGGGAAPGDGFEPDGLSPVLFVASTEPSFDHWMPLKADPKTDCVAGIKAAP